MSEENKVPKDEVQQETPAQEAPQTEETSIVEEPVAETPATEVSEETQAVEETESEASKAEETKEEPTAEETVTDEPTFSWDDVEAGEATLSEDRKALAAMYEETLGSSLEHQVVEGKVTSKTDREVIIDINSKSEGVVSLNEFRYNPELSVGDTVEVLVDRQEDKYGQLVLSHRKASPIRAWDRANEAHDNDEIVKGYVKARTKGGMIVDVFGLEAVLARFTN